MAGGGLGLDCGAAARLTDKPLTGTYSTVYGQNLRGGWSVPRAHVADVLLGVLGQPQTIHQIIGIAS